METCPRVHRATRAPSNLRFKTTTERCMTLLRSSSCAIIFTDRINKKAATDERKHVKRQARQARQGVGGGGDDVKKSTTRTKSNHYYRNGSETNKNNLNLKAPSSPSPRPRPPLPPLAAGSRSPSPCDPPCP